MKHLFLKLALLIFVVSACGGTSNKQNNENAANDMAPATEEATMPVAQPPAEEEKAVVFTAPQLNQKMIKEANVSLEVKKYSIARKSLLDLARKYNAYITSENQDNNEYRINGDFVVRVGAENFDKFVDELVSIGIKVIYKRISAQDVTEEFVDIQARLKTKREVEKRYLDILNRARTIEDILKVEESLRVIREEIEAREGRLKFLENRVGFSTVNLNIFETLDYKYVPDSKPGFFSRIVKALRTGWTAVVDVFIGLIYIWPLILIALFIFFLIRRIRRRRKQKKANPGMQ